MWPNQAEITGLVQEKFTTKIMSRGVTNKPKRSNPDK